MSVSLWHSGALNLVSAMDATPILYWYTWECCSVPYSRTLRGNSSRKSQAVTSLQHFQPAVCISLPLPPRWMSCQDPFHSPAALLAYQNPEPTTSRHMCSNLFVIVLRTVFILSWYFLDRGPPSQPPPASELPLHYRRLPFGPQWSVSCSDEGCANWLKLWRPRNSSHC